MDDNEAATLTDEEWRERLSPEQYAVLRKAGTEPPFSGKYALAKDQGVYRCAGCGVGALLERHEVRLGYGLAVVLGAGRRGGGRAALRRLSTAWSATEVVCRRCGGHLGHVFDDGPNPTGQRYCINSLSLELDPTESD